MTLWFTDMRRWLPVAISIAVVAATFLFLLPRIADYRDVWDVITTLAWPEIAALLGVTALNVLTYAFPWQASLPGLRYWSALTMSQASAALSLVMPGGGAVGAAGAFGMLRAWGFSGGDVARSVTLTTLWSQFVNLAYPVVAVFLLTATGGSTAPVATAAFVGVAILGVAVAGLVLVLWSDQLARDIGDVAARAATWALGRIRRGPVTWDGGSFERFRGDAVDLLRRRWHVLTLATVVSSLAVFAVFLVCLRVLDVPSAEVTAVEAFAAWALVRLLGSVPITPGGIGIIELGLTGALVAFGGDNAQVVAAVLVFRVLTMLPTLALGLLAAFTWRRHHPEVALETQAPPMP